MAKAFAPGNLSCIFKIINNSKIEKKHSLGVGITTKKGVYVTAAKAKKNIVYFNNKKIRFPTVVSVVKKLTNKKLKIDIKSELTLGAGFGISGASALAAAYAINKLLKLNKNKKQLAMIAHTAEVENSTGLGDVGGQYNGLGFMIKTKKGKPLDVEKLPIKAKYIYYKVFKKLDTKKIITNKKMKAKINKAADKALKKISSTKNINLKKLIDVSEEFAVESGLLRHNKLKKIIKKIKEMNGSASMIMLGNSVFSNIPFPGCKKVKVGYRGAYVYP